MQGCLRWLRVAALSAMKIPRANRRAIVRLSLGICITMQGLEASAGSLADRLGSAGYFAASVQNAAFLVRDADGFLNIFFVDFETANRRRLRIKGSDLLSPFLSPDGTRLLFVRHPRHKIGRELVSCDTARFDCRSILKSEGLMSFPVEIPGRQILYVSSPYFKDADGRGRYNMKDLWIFSPDSGPRKLTNMRLYDLSSISASEAWVYFSAVGPPRDNPVIPKFDSSAKVRSDIFKTPLNRERGSVEVAPKPIGPLFAEEGISVSPSVSFDDLLVTFRRTRSDTGNYRYDLIVKNQIDQTTLLLRSRGLGFSRPVVIDRSVYANDIHHDRFSIQVLKPGERQMQQLAEVLDATINSIGPTEINLK
jgi:hypothetical protein